MLDSLPIVCVQKYEGRSPWEEAAPLLFRPPLNSDSETYFESISAGRIADASQKCIAAFHRHPAYDPFDNPDGLRF